MDQSANADGQRRRLTPAGHEGASRGSRPDLAPAPPTGMAPLLRERLAEYAATGVPPVYLPSIEPPQPHARPTDSNTPNTTPDTPNEPTP